MYLVRGPQIVVSLGSERVDDEREGVHPAVESDEFDPSRRDLTGQGNHVFLISTTTQLDDLDDLHARERWLADGSRSGLSGLCLGLYSTPG